MNIPSSNLPPRVLASLNKPTAGTLLNSDGLPLSGCHVLRPQSRFYSYFVLHPCSHSQRESQRSKCEMNTESQAQIDQVWTFSVTVVNILHPTNDQIPKLLVLLPPKIQSVSAFVLKSIPLCFVNLQILIISVLALYNLICIVCQANIFCLTLRFPNFGLLLSKAF